MYTNVHNSVNQFLPYKNAYFKIYKYSIKIRKK